jgi:hypothetical protein
MSHRIEEFDSTEPVESGTEGAAQAHTDAEQRLSRASDAQSDSAAPATQETQSSGNLDLPDGARPAGADTERGAGSRAETGPERPEVGNFDVEPGPPKPPEGWQPGGPEGSG